MRQVLSGSGQDTTSIVMSVLQSRKLYLATLYLIGEPEDAAALWLTDWSTPLSWPLWGKFRNTRISRGSVTSEIGLKVQTLNVTWSPRNFTFTQDVATTSPYQQALLGQLDGATFRAWTAYMPVPGDANTYGASELFGGRVGPISIERGKITFTVNSFLDVINQQVPGPVIESTNTLSGFAGATPPAGTTTVPVFTVVSATDNQLVGSGGGTFSFGDFTDGFVYMLSGTLAGNWSAIYFNSNTSGGNTTFTLGQPFPWAPDPGDQFYASANLGNFLTGSGLYPFPYVPAPEQAM